MKVNRSTSLRAVFASVAEIALCATTLRATDWFEVSFANYALGQSLSQQGAVGGTWQMPLPADATNVYDGIRNGMSVRSEMGESMLFAPIAPTAGGDVERIDFGMCPEELTSELPLDFDGAAALTPALLNNGTPSFVGFTADGWIELSATGVTVEAGTWFDGRIELRTVDGIRLVSYLVKNGNDWVRLANTAGVTWFRTTAPRNEGGLESVSFVGDGLFSGFAGREEDGDPLRLFRWTGGASGDWNNAANWSIGGAVAESAPGTNGDIALVDGAVALTSGSESCAVRDLTLGFSDGGSAQRMGGEMELALELDAARPRAGKALEATVGSFLGITPGYTYEWWRADVNKSYESGLLASGTAYTPQRGDYDHWIKFRAMDGHTRVYEKEFFFSKLPVLYLSTDDGATPSAEKEPHDGQMFAQGNDEWKSLYDGKMEIKVRGNSTKNYPKKPWKVKLDKKTEMFGIPKSKHWVLLANYNDESMLRNKLASDFANDIGVLGMKSTWVECVLNGEWQGTYQFCEHVRIAKDRVNVHDWEGDAGDIAEAFAKANALTGDQEDALATQLEQDLSWITSDSFTFYDATNGVTLTGQPSTLLKKFTDDITGGYLFEFSNEYDEISKFTLTGSLPLKTMLKSPEFLNSNPAMMTYCQTYLQNYFDACTAVDGYSGEGKYISEYCDFESMIGYWLVMELFGNNDAIYKSRYAYKEQGKKLVWGPVWDFDWGVGSVRVSGVATDWKCRDHAQSFYKEWTDNPEFCTRLYTRYWQVRDRFASCMATGGIIDQATNYLHEACLANSAKWDWYYNQGSGGFAADVERLKTYLSARLAWLDAQFASVPTLMASLNTTMSAQPYTADATMLPIAFIGLNNNGALYTGRPLQTRFRTSSTAVATISCFVNGIRVTDRKAVQKGLFDATIPAEAFTAALGEPNCVAFIAYDIYGDVVARNFALVDRISPATIFLLR